MFLLILIGCGGGADTDSGGSTAGGSGGSTAGGSGGTIKLAWDSNTEPNLAGYKIYYGTVTGTYDRSIDVGNVTTYDLTGLTQGQTYFIVATAYDKSNNESGYSNEVSIMVR